MDCFGNSGGTFRYHQRASAFARIFERLSICAVAREFHAKVEKCMPLEDFIPEVSNPKEIRGVLFSIFVWTLTNHPEQGYNFWIITWMTNVVATANMYCRLGLYDSEKLLLMTQYIPETFSGLFFQLLETFKANWQLKSDGRIAVNGRNRRICKKTRQLVLCKIKRKRLWFRCYGLQSCQLGW